MLFQILLQQTKVTMAILVQWTLMYMAMVLMVFIMIMIISTGVVIITALGGDITVSLDCGRITMNHIIWVVILQPLLLLLSILLSLRSLLQSLWKLLLLNLINM